MELSEEEFASMRAYILRICGMDIREEKKYLIKQRIEPLVRALGCSSFGEYHQKLMQEPFASYEKDLVISAITTNETSFFRDTKPFDAFRDHLLPRLGKNILQIKQKNLFNKGPKVRIWSAGTSTGQEAYTIAILIHEYIEKNRYSGIGPKDFSIMASDISPVALSKAEAGIYSESEAARGLSDIYLKKYFTFNNKQWKVNESLRRMVEFKRLNLAEPFSITTQFDLIFCRNVLIYFDENNKKQIFERFSKALAAHGHIILGATENIYCITDKFTSVRYGDSIFYVKSDHL
ncbi:Chemotaxis protein methyltransferase [Desulfonema limicola]|uniref:protein-glutamate O-methyltransferase n=1 Tax=Desulfonema limicola TaxID=45656 RepID=A0A975BE74_9BACT|nr:protein-glutamate O-methyltransferase CheR [Desulfonema limicola]QTA83721.1 Chemotaxis protein methyltransferase [Desulfonema limicola]